MKLKEALVKDGFLKPDQMGRGRPSKAMIERAKELVSQGWEIEGFSKSTTPTKPVVEHKPSVINTKEIADVGPPLRDPDEWEAMVNGKPYRGGIKAVCNTCSNSLTYCPCPSPIVNLDYNLTGVVEFRRRKESV